MANVIFRREEADRIVPLENLNIRVEYTLTKRAEFSDEMDKWNANISLRDAGGNVLYSHDTEYSTGLAHRKKLAGTYAKSRHYICDYAPHEPLPTGILYCLVSDYDCARYMPRDDMAAMDYLQDEFGYSGDTKASELLRIVRALRAIADMVDAMCRAGRVPVETFLERFRDC